MPELIDFIERTVKGPIFLEKDFNLKVLVPNIAETVKQFDIKYEKDSPIVSDNSLSDRLFEGAVELITKTGIYCEDTNRIIQIEKKEIEESILRSPASVFGEGKERRELNVRKPDDSNLPWFHVGTGIVASSEDIALAVVEGYGKIEEACSISIPAFSKVHGLKVMGGSPLEILATINSVQAGRKALMNAGRPGLPILNLISSATTAVSTIAGSSQQFGLRSSDGWLIDFIAEMHINFESLNRLMFVQMIGGNIGSTALPILGGYAGGPAGTALVMTAYHILGQVILNGNYHLTGPIHFTHGCSSTREALWVMSAVGRAISRNTRYPAIGLGYAASGPATEMYFYETTALALSIVTSGYAGIQTVHPAKAIIEDGVTPIEARFTVDITKAICGMNGKEANDIASKLLEKYESRIPEAPQGKRFKECYDVEKIKPLDDYKRLYDKVKDELTKIGIKL